jgi:hypothetical protein
MVKAAAHDDRVIMLIPLRASPEQASGFPSMFIDQHSGETMQSRNCDADHA